MVANGCEKVANLFICEYCHYSTRKKSSITKHFLSTKHKNRTNLNNIEQNSCKQLYNCKQCGKEYKARNSLWYHEQKCNYGINNENIVINDAVPNIDKLTNLIMEVVKNNSDLQKQTLEMQQQILEVCKNSNNTTNNNNCHNKTFNMQLFLNEKCKDAMNLMDFVNSMTLDFSDLEELGELGYVEGISRQMVRKLNEMDVYKRPIHCSDLKRETVYVRDNDVWEKETELYEKLRTAIKYITKKNGDLMIPWRNAHPQCMNLQHPLNDKYLGIMNQAMGGKGEFAESESKIIKKISKCVTIDKKDM